MRNGPQLMVAGPGFEPGSTGPKPILVYLLLVRSGMLKYPPVHNNVDV